MFEHKSFLHALKWAYVGSLGEKAFSTVLYLVLAGLLGPRDFGIASLAIIYVDFLKLFLDQGLATALIQKKDITEENLNAVFWMDVGLSVGLVLIGVSFSHVWGYLSHSPGVAIVASVLSAGIILEALSVVQVAILRREMNFSKTLDPGEHRQFHKSGCRSSIGVAGGRSLGVGGPGSRARSDRTCSALETS